MRACARQYQLHTTLCMGMNSVKRSREPLPAPGFCCVWPTMMGLSHLRTVLTALETEDRHEARRLYIPATRIDHACLGLTAVLPVDPFLRICQRPGVGMAKAHPAFAQPITSS